MTAQDCLSTDPGPALPLAMAADLQDHLMVASNDLDRLQRLLDDASGALLGHFTGATHQLDGGAFDAARQTLGSAITALQFQDMASQLIHHTTHRLRACADRIARDAMGDDEDGMALVADLPQRPKPGDAGRDGRRLGRAVLSPSEPSTTYQTFFRRRLHALDPCR